MGGQPSSRSAQWPDAVQGVLPAGRSTRAFPGGCLLSGCTAETLDLADLLGMGALFVAKPFTPLDLARAVATPIATPMTAVSRDPSAPGR